MGTLFVTGGAGFIGANLVYHILASEPDRIVIIDKLTYAGHAETVEAALRDPRVELVRADIADPGAMQALFARHAPSAVLNLAAETHVDRSIDDPRPFIDTNIVGTFVLLEASRRYLRERPDAVSTFRFLHVSTDEVYGTLGPTGAFTETTPYAPNSPYAASKASADHLVRAYFHTYSLPVLLTNCSNNYGPYQFPEKLIPLMILNAVEGRQLPVYGDGSNVRDWLHVEDHCTGLLRVLHHGRFGEKYNIGGMGERTNLQVLDALCDALEALLPAAQNPALRATGSYRELRTFVPDRPGHDRRYAIDSTKIQQELGWRPARSFEDSLRATVRWYLEHRDWCEAVQAGVHRQRLGLGAPGRQRS
jgi:dTDP-glucose 4,6-dehydratase